MDKDKKKYPLTTFRLTPQELDNLDRIRYEFKLKTRTDAIRWLIDAGIFYPSLILYVASRSS